jgi:SAM-dependent methyltransferase
LEVRPVSVPDFGKAAGDYARHRQGFPDRLFGELARDSIGVPGQRVLDLGTGTGLMAREMARRGGVVTALDPSAEMLGAARAASEAEGLEITHVQARAEATGLADSSFDVITAATCWHWFDRPAAAAECHRLLVPGGKLVIAHQDWLRRPGNVIDATLETIRRWNPPDENRQWTFQYPAWLFDLTDAGFGDYRVVAFPAMLPHTREAWVGRIVASAHIGPALPPDRIAAFREDFTSVLAERFPDPMDVEHRVFAIILSRD